MKNKIFKILIWVCLIITIGFCSVVSAGAMTINAYKSASSDIVSKADNKVFASKGIPQMPSGNKNLMADSNIKMKDFSGGGLGVKYIDGVVKNTNDAAYGVFLFEGINGMRSNDTYVLKYTYIVDSTNPNLDFQDFKSMGARVSFRGVDKKTFLAFSLFKDSAMILVYHDNQIIDVPVSVPFNRDDHKEYRIMILTSKDTARISVNGVEIINATNLPEYDFLIGGDIARAAVTIKNFELYNVNSDNPEVNAVKSTPAAQTFPGDTIAKTATSKGEKINMNFIILLICGVIVTGVIIFILVLTLTIILKRQSNLKKSSAQEPNQINIITEDK